ncbi:MAG: alpha/beta hydrolase [Kiritimatiellae bacterium]|nr:alpha/beta hydrolase [Kiritimatiellia bacterium]
MNRCVFFAMALLSVPLYADVAIYIPGWLKCHAPTSAAPQRIQRLAPSGTFLYYDWDGNRTWGASLRNAELEAERLAGELMRLDDAALEKITIVGHSLGARIAVRALAQISRHGRRIRKAYLLGAAIACDDADIEAAMYGTKRGIVFVCNGSEFTLAVLYSSWFAENEKALGVEEPAKLANGSRTIWVEPQDIRDARIPALWGKFAPFRKIAAHHAMFYATALARYLESGTFAW